MKNHRVDINLGPFGTNVVNSIKVDGQDVHCTDVHMSAGVDKPTTVVLELSPHAVNLSLENVDVRLTKPAPSYFEYQRARA